MKLQLCRVRHAVVADGRVHRLPDLSFRMLDLLASGAPNPVSFAEIERVVWNAHVTRETIKQRVTLLRESLSQIGVDGAAIEAVRNHGYRTILTMDILEPAGRGSVRRKVALAAILTFALAAASVPLLRNSGDSGPAILAVSVTPPPPGIKPAHWDSLRRGMVRAISKFEGVQVIDQLPSSGARPAYIVRIALEESGNSPHLATELVEGQTGAILFAEQYRYSPTDTERAILHFANNVHAQISPLSANGAVMPDEERGRYAEAFRLWRVGDR